MNYTIANAALLFFVYGFLGWCVEVAFAACKKNGGFVNRGFLNGPICPIYGVGMLGVLLLLEPVSDNLPLLYAGSFVLTTLVELITGMAMEKLFHAKWWDYSRMPLNIGGHVCLLLSLVWGAACVVIVKWIHPLIFGLVDGLPDPLVYVLDGLFFGVFAVDLVATLASIRKLNERLAALTQIAGEIREVSDGLGEGIAGTTLAARKKLEQGQQMLGEQQQKLGARIEELRDQSREARERIDEKRDQSRESGERRLTELRVKLNGMLGEKRFGHRRLLEAFPNLTSVRYPESLSRLREFIQARKKK